VTAPPYAREREVSNMPCRPEVMSGELTPQEQFIELMRIVSIPEASRLSGLSHDSLQRHYADKIIHLSERRRGMRLRDALLLAKGE
jgi:hypothetical protein